jgi:hypothetical protein
MVPFGHRSARKAILVQPLWSFYSRALSIAARTGLDETYRMKLGVWTPIRREPRMVRAIAELQTYGIEPDGTRLAASLPAQATAGSARFLDYLPKHDPAWVARRLDMARLEAL